MIDVNKRADALKRYEEIAIRCDSLEQLHYISRLLGYMHMWEDFEGLLCPIFVRIQGSSMVTGPASLGKFCSFDDFIRDSSDGGTDMDFFARLPIAIEIHSEEEQDLVVDAYNDYAQSNMEFRMCEWSDNGFYTVSALRRIYGREEAACLSVGTTCDHIGYGDRHYYEGKGFAIVQFDDIFCRADDCGFGSVSLEEFLFCE